MTQHNVPWPLARELASGLGRLGATEEIRLDQSLGLTLAAPIVAMSDLPAFDTVSMDGWAVADASGPWRVRDSPVLAGTSPAPIAAGTAVPIATGATPPTGAIGVLRREDGNVINGQLHRRSGVPPLPDGKQIRRRGEEATRGAQLLPAGIVLTPPMLGLAAAAGLDTLAVRPAPIVDVFIMGDELLSQGPSGDGRLRDSLRPQVIGWLTSVGAAAGTVALLPDTSDATVAALATSTADIVMTTGGTARGPVDQLHPALTELTAEVVIDQVAVRPGHPMVLGRLSGGRPLVGLPGNPLAAAVGFVTLAWPVIERIRGLPVSTLTSATALEAISAPPTAHRLMPSALRADGIRPLLHHGPAMLSGLAAADCLAIAPPGGVEAGDPVDVLRLPWIR